MGDGSTGGLRTPALVKTNSTHVQVAMARSFACARTKDGRLECWGGTFGPTPTLVTALKDVTFIGGGYEHMCAVHESGRLSCWGRNDSSEASGNGARTPVPESSPALIPLPGPAIAVSVGHAGSCALLASGKVRCWGLGGSGEIGVGSFADHFRPDEDARLPDAVAIGGGFFGTCAKVRNGDAYCWGRLPGGDATCGLAGNLTTPRIISNDVAAVGGRSPKGGCLLLASGTPTCWSTDNVFGELGLGFFGSGVRGTSACIPGAVPGVTTAVAIDSRAGSVWVVLADGTIRTWGNDSNGQLGDGASGPNQPSPVQLRLP